MKTKNSKKVMVGLIGIDYDELKKTSAKNVDRFFITAIFVVGILILSFVSVFYAFELMFHIWHVQILLSLFFSLMFGIIYILLIQTFSKQSLASKNENTLNASNILRGGFILLIGFLISKPIEILLLNNPLQQDIESYKNELKTSFEEKIKKIYAGDIKKTEQRILETKNIISEQSYYQEAFKQLATLKSKEKESIEKAHQRINSSSFFLQRIRFATKKYHISKIISTSIIIIFFIPAALVYLVSSNNKYYISKAEAERKLVINHYQYFRQLYTKVFYRRFQLENKGFYESHTDPPFRTIRITPPACKSETDFFTSFNSNELPERLLQNTGD